LCIAGHPLIVERLQNNRNTVVCQSIQGDSKVALAVFALAAYFLFAAIAFWFDKKRS